MPNVVLDTNILVSGLLSPQGSSARILSALIDGRITCFFSEDIIGEYEAVLSRDRFGFPPKEVERLIESIKKIGQPIAPRNSTHPMTDESDRMFYDAAKAAFAYLITGNAKHFPDETFVITPARFADEMLGGG